jgi:uncharacterized protein (DUF1778 family)
MTPEEEDLQAWQRWWDHAETIYLSQENYDKLVERINAPPNPKTVASLKKLLERKAPWDEHNN